jgi:organic radical activating enzyme
MKLISSLSKFNSEIQTFLSNDNPFAFPEHANWDNQHYAINEEFLSIQGEGMHTGVVQYFIRLQGCQVGCYFCDTKYTWRPEKDYDKFVRMADIVKRARKSKASWVCITGGEPFEQDLRPLIHKLRLEGLSIHIETSGQYIPN